MFYPMEYIHVGNKIEELLYKKGMTKTVMAQHLGMSQGNSSYITKRETLDVKTLHQVGVML
jgi:DNA-binding Xre family transcriptional regulator